MVLGLTGRVVEVLRGRGKGKGPKGGGVLLLM